MNLADRVHEIKQLTQFAYKLEDGGDLEGAYATMVSLGDLIEETIAEGDELRASSDGDMERTAAMEKEAIWAGLKNLLKSIKGGAKGLWNAIKGGPVSKSLDEALQPGAARRALIRDPDDLPAGMKAMYDDIRPDFPAGPVGDTTAFHKVRKAYPEAADLPAYPVPGMEYINYHGAPQYTPGARIGAGALGAGAIGAPLYMADRASSPRRRPDQFPMGPNGRPDPGSAYPASPMDVSGQMGLYGAGGYGGRPYATTPSYPSSRMAPRGMGGYPSSRMAPRSMGGYPSAQMAPGGGGYPSAQMAPGGGMGGAQLAGLSSGLSSLTNRFTNLDMRVRNLEGQMMAA